jgi:hypothetical protein
MALVVSGLLNKQVGGELGISEITVKVHRWPGDAQDECRLASRLGDDGRQTVDAETLTSDTRRPIPSCNGPLVTDVVQSREMITGGT